MGSSDSIWISSSSGKYLTNRAQYCSSVLILFIHYSSRADKALGPDPKPTEVSKKTPQAFLVIGILYSVFQSLEICARNFIHNWKAGRKAKSKLPDRQKEEKENASIW